MKKINWKRGVVTAVTAGLMLTSAPGVALAEGVKVTSSNAPQKIEKTWTVASPYQYLSTQKFYFDLTYAGATAVNGNALQNFDSFETKEVDLTTAGSKDSLEYTGDKAIYELLKDIEFTNPGVYYFNLTERDEGNNINDSISYNTTDKQYTVQVTVVWDDVAQNTVKIEAVNLAEGAYGTASFAEGAKTDTASFANNTNKANGELKLTKYVSGTAANTADKFTFDVSLEGLEPGYDYQVTGTSGKVTGAVDITADESGKATLTGVEIQHGGTLTISNLPKDATYEISEKGNGGYNKGTEVSGADTNPNVVSEATTVDITASGTIEATDDSDAVVYTNKNGFAADTGITANTLPFVAVAAVAVAGGVTLVISRRRRAGEDF